MIIILIVVGVVIGAAAVYFYLNPKVKATQVLDEQTKRENEQIRTELIQLKSEYSALVDKTLAQEQHIKKIQQQAEDSANTIYEKSFELANERMSAAAEKMSAEYEEARQKAEQEYIELMACQSATLVKELSATNTEIKNAELRLAGLAAKVSAAVAAAKRQEEMETAQDFYRLNLPDIDIEEIIKLRQAINAF